MGAIVFIIVINFPSNVTYLQQCYSKCLSPKVPGLAKPALTGCLLGMQILWPQPEPSRSEIVIVEPRNDVTSLQMILIHSQV